MQLMKMFKFGGLFQGGRRMDPPLGSFRRFTNAYKDRAGRILPFGTDGGSSNTPSASVGLPNTIVWDKSYFSSVFRGGIFQMLGATYAAKPVGSYKFEGDSGQGLDVAQVFAPNHLMQLDDTNQYAPAGNFSSAVVNNKLFFCEYVDRSKFEIPTSMPVPQVEVFNLLKFDGIQVARAGLPTPYSVVQEDSTGDSRFRTIYFTIGLDGEVVFSNRTDVLAKNLPLATITYYLGGYTDAPLTVRRTDSVGTAGGVFPPTRDPGDYLYDDGEQQYQNRKWVQLPTSGGVANYSLVPGTGYVIINCPKSSPGLTMGDWVLSVSPPTIFSALGPMIYTAFYFKVKTIAGTTYTFDSKIKKFNSVTVSWEDHDLETEGYPNGDTPTPGQKFAAQVGSSTALSNIQAVVSKASGVSGAAIYENFDLLPIMWDSNITFTRPTPPTTFNRNILGVITPLVADMYDETIVKTTFPPVIGITNYSNLLVGFDENALYFHDTSLGGSSEMVSGISNLVPYGSEFGAIVAICGSENFLFMSRERKNYVITGELTTGQVNIRECDSAVKGAANARAVTNSFSDQVLFMNKTGIYGVSSAGTIEPISSSIQDLFTANPQSKSTPNDGNLFNKDVFRSAAQQKGDGFDGGIFRITLEEQRGFIFFLTGKRNQDAGRTLAQSNVLVYDTNDGSWYEWYGYQATTIEALDGKARLMGSNITSERDKMLSGLPAIEARQMLLLTQRMTMGEPSLEKMVNQVKFYGFIEKGGSFLPTTIMVGQQNGFADFVLDPTKLNTYVNYPPLIDGTIAQEGKIDGVYAHKQRLDSSKTQAFSLLFKTTNGELLTLEGLEIEAEVVQSEMKQ